MTRYNDPELEKPYDPLPLKQALPSLIIMFVCMLLICFASTNLYSPKVNYEGYTGGLQIRSTFLSLPTVTLIQPKPILGYEHKLNTEEKIAELEEKLKKLEKLKEKE